MGDSESRSPLRTFIYGSCVTRDAEHLFPDHGLMMVGYVARQSLISAFSPASIDGFNLSKISSSFQRRMARGDIEGNLVEQLRLTRPDLIIWDICDERLGIAPLSDGGIVTLAHRYERDSIYRHALGDPLSFGEDAHFFRWLDALGSFTEFLRAENLLDRLVVNSTPWATHDESGLRTPAYDRAVKFNSDSERYYGAMADAGLRVVPIRRSDTVSRTDGHKWGPAPFHYLESTYVAMVTALASAHGVKSRNEPVAVKGDVAVANTLR